MKKLKLPTFLYIAECFIFVGWLLILAYVPSVGIIFFFYKELYLEAAKPEKPLRNMWMAPYMKFSPDTDSTTSIIYGTIFQFWSQHCVITAWIWHPIDHIENW